jgi:catechol 2,3-dioxygenase-like lactoylglutathione lyase family enzyme
MSLEHKSVPARITTVTLGARNVKKLRDFYAQLGWPILVDSDNFVAFHTKSALLALFALDDLAADAGAEANAPETGLRGFTLAINVEAPEQVDSTIATVRSCGGRVSKEPVDATLFDGRTAYFADPEDNYWEVVYFGGGGAVGEAVQRMIQAS